MKSIREIFASAMVFIVDALINLRGRQHRIRLNKHSHFALQLMEHKGFVEWEDFLQVANQHSEAWPVAAGILGIKNSEIPKYMKLQKIPAESFVPALKEGLETFYDCQNTTS